VGEYEEVVVDNAGVSKLKQKELRKYMKMFFFNFNQTIKIRGILSQSIIRFISQIEVTTGHGKIKTCRDRHKKSSQ